MSSPQSYNQNDSEHSRKYENGLREFKENINARIEDFVREFQDFEVFHDDVWIITIPKSGTHWMQETLCCLLHGMDFEKLKSRSYQRAYNMEVPALAIFRNLQIRDINDVVKHCATLERPRVLKTHLSWDQLPKKLRDPNCKAKIVYVARNPKDVCVSWYHFSKMIPSGDNFFEKIKTLELHSNEFLQDNLMFLPYWSHVLSFWNRKDTPKVLFIKYEEMKADFFKVLVKLQEFLGLKPLTEQEKEAVTDYLSFEKMKTNEAAVDYMHCHGKVYSKTYKNSDKEATFMRKGQAGGWKEEMSPEMIQRFDEWILKNTAGTGYSVDIE